MNNIHVKIGLCGKAQGALQPAGQKKVRVE